jgi:hypothetical protein
MHDGIDTIRQRIASATHRAVCDFTNSDGCGRCFQYALAGWALATKVFQRPYMLQAGSLYIVVDPPNGVLALEPGQHGFNRGEFHCWFVAQENGMLTEFVDLSSRHYKQLVERSYQASEISETKEFSVVTLCQAAGGSVKRRMVECVWRKQAAENRQ